MADNPDVVKVKRFPRGDARAEHEAHEGGLLKAVSVYREIRQLNALESR